MTDFRIGVSWLTCVSHHLQSAEIPHRLYRHTRLPWLWPLYRRPQKLRASQIPTSFGFCLVPGLFTATETSTPLEPSPLSLSTYMRVGSCGRSLRFSPSLPSSFRRLSQLSMFHSIPRFVLTEMLGVGKINAHTIQNPAVDVNSEQTASWFSFIFFFFLDDIIFKASRVSHLPVEGFPPLADYDWAPHLVKRSLSVRSHIPHICCA